MVLTDLEVLEALLQCAQLIQKGHDLGLISGDQRTSYETAMKPKVQTEILRLNTL